jgi:hypothetical protein
MVLMFEIGAQKAAAALWIFISDRQTNDTGIKISHLHEVIANDTHMPPTLNHSSASLSTFPSVTAGECVVTLTRF